MSINTLLFPLGLLPSIAILYIIIRNYEGKFVEKNIFILFVVGFVFGIFIYLLERFTFFIESTLNLLIYSFLFSLVEQLSKFIILNLKRFYDKAITIYGASFGLGFSSLFATFFVIELVAGIEIIFFIILVISVIIYHCNSGITISLGIRRREKLKYFIISFFMGVLIWVIVIIFSSYNLVSILSFALSTSIFFLLYKKYLPFEMLTRKEILSKKS
ncbi:MAG: hypothetical protein H5T45_05025 [Thermoplasmatales archaeon]|nr:hypothetical protein [Thermoplasmatales archaeon]